MIWQRHGTWYRIEPIHSLGSQNEGNPRDENHVRAKVEDRLIRQVVQSWDRKRHAEFLI